MARFKMKMAVACVAWAACGALWAQSQEILPVVSNERVAEPLDIGREEDRLVEGLGEPQARPARARRSEAAAAIERLDRLAMGSAQAAMVALKCEGPGFERAAARIQARLGAAVREVDVPWAGAYAHRQAKKSYAALVRSSEGASCAQLDGMRAAASAEGFD